MPDPPNIATPDGSSLAGDPDSLFSEENPSGNEKDTNMGAANVAHQYRKEMMMKKKKKKKK